jgi:hypothetical protein
MDIEQPAGDSYEKLLADTLSLMDDGLSKMSPAERTKAIADIHAIAEGIRNREVQSAG